MMLRKSITAAVIAAFEMMITLISGMGYRRSQQQQWSSGE